MKDLIATGKVEHLVLSDAGGETIRKARVVQPATTLLSGYSLFWRGPEDETSSVLEELGIGLVSFSPLGAGFLPGQIDENAKFDPTDFRKHVTRFSLEARMTNMVFVHAIGAEAKLKGITTAQCALA